MHHEKLAIKAIQKISLEDPTASFDICFDHNKWYVRIISEDPRQISASHADFAQAVVDATVMWMERNQTHSNE